jgi:hypothetical protein
LFSFVFQARAGATGGQAVSKLSGFLQLRRGVFEHVRDGRMTRTAAFCYIYMLTQADTRTGIWSGSAGALAGELAMPVGTARHVLEALDKGYIKRFPTPGRHSCYPIALHKFLITEGEHKGQHLNALDSISPTDQRYFLREQMGEQDFKQVDEQLGAQKRIETRDERRTTAAKTAPPSEPRHRPFLDVAFPAYELKHGRRPIWSGKDFDALKTLLKGQSVENLPLSRLKSLWQNYLNSTEPFTAKQADSLAYFCSNIDKFSDGPILAAPGKGVSNGNRKPTVGDNMRATIEAYRATVRATEQKAS